MEKEKLYTVAKKLAGYASLPIADLKKDCEIHFCEKALKDFVSQAAKIVENKICNGYKTLTETMTSKLDFFAQKKAEWKNLDHEQQADNLIIDNFLSELDNNQLKSTHFVTAHKKLEEMLKTITELKQDNEFSFINSVLLFEHKISKAKETYLSLQKRYADGYHKQFKVFRLAVESGPRNINQTESAPETL